MKKKKIAVFSTGWSGEILYSYLRGLVDGFSDISADLYLFLSQAVYGPTEQQQKGELNIYNLPNMADFDAALVFANGLDYPDVLADIKKRCQEAGIPTIFTGKDDPDFYFVGSDNYVGTKQLGEHLLNQHQVKDIWFIAGSPDNMDSNTRLQAIRDVMADHNLTFLDDNVCYTNWSPYLAYTYVINRIRRGDKYPDAIVCANDTLAMVICSEFRKNGIKVPEDIIVTGFDNEYYAQIYDPSISTVDQRFDNIGRKCTDVLKNLFQGIPTERTHTIACEFIPSESCGCTSAQDFDALRRKIGRDKFEEKINSSNFDIKLTSIERALLQAKHYGELGNSLEDLNKIHTEYEGPTFHVVLDPLFEQTISDQQIPLRVTGYPDRMDAVYSKDNCVTRLNTMIDTREIVPQFTETKGNRFFIISPLHENEFCFGYLVFGDDLEKLKDSPIHRKYCERFNLVIGKFYQNMRLDALNRRLLQMTETDALTRVKNRTAFETKQNGLQLAIESSAKPSFAIILFDVNNLKKINDNLGHEAGDEYIINSCKLICTTFKKSAVYRIGGDEFVAVLQNEDYDNRVLLLSSLHQKMEELSNSDLPIYEKISIASGMAVYNPEEDQQISDVFNRADALMYENKAYMKQQMLKK